MKFFIVCGGLQLGCKGIFEHNAVVSKIFLGNNFDLFHLGQIDQIHCKSVFLVQSTDHKQHLVCEIPEDNSHGYVGD